MKIKLLWSCLYFSFLEKENCHHSSDPKKKGLNSPKPPINQAINHALFGSILYQILENKSTG